MIVVTGGAGFIGSALIHGLNNKGVKEIWVVDQVDHPEKQKNLNHLVFDKLVDKDIFLNDVLSLELSFPKQIRVLTFSLASSCKIL